MLEEYCRNTAGIPWECCRNDAGELQEHYSNLRGCCTNTAEMLEEYSSSTTGIPWECCRNHGGLLQKYWMHTIDKYYFRNAALQESCRNATVLQSMNYKMTPCTHIPPRVHTPVARGLMRPPVAESPGLASSMLTDPQLRLEWHHRNPTPVLLAC